MSDIHPTNPACSKVRVLFEPGPPAKVTAQHIALIGTFTPRRCGIATFTTDIFEKLAEFEPRITVDVYAIDDSAQPLDYKNVTGTIRADDPVSYARTADTINASNVDAVWLQHEFGIFGGRDGEMVRGLVERLAPPLILTPHTVLRKPNDRQAAILRHLVARSSRIMVMSRHARDLLAEHYGAPHDLLEVIEHGAPDRPLGRQAQFKTKLGLQDRDVLTTFGLLGPGKGLETVIEALPAIAARHPQVLYRIVGATHPVLAARDGESYRDNLMARVEELGVAGHVQWVNRFLETEELLDQLEACDIYLTPYTNLQQSTSGTLSYAVALGKAIISTPYLHATELLENDVGRLIAPHSSEAIAAEVNALLDNRATLHALQQRAYAKGRKTIWPCFARASARLVDRACAPAVRPPAVTPTAPGLHAVLTMSDATGMFQHAIGTVPDRNHGYCLDDNVRALMLINLAHEMAPRERSRWWHIYASFVQYCWNPGAARFRNFMNFERTFCEDIGSEDSNGRAFWALGQTLEKSPDPDLRIWAVHWFDTALPSLRAMDSPRAMAFVMLGCAARLRAQPDHVDSREVLHCSSARLAHLLDQVRRPDWVWFEAVLAYDNPRLSQALIEAGTVLEDPRLVQAGIDSLEWIAARQVAAKGHFRPIGSDSFGRGILPFDQQPLEAQAAIDAALAAWRASGDDRWKVHATIAWNWFFGANDRGTVLADLASGRCRDGINPRGANANCGAESILAFQLAYRSMIALGLDKPVESDGARNVGRKQQTEYAVAHS